MFERFAVFLTELQIRTMLQPLRWRLVATCLIGACSGQPQGGSASPVYDGGLGGARVGGASGGANGAAGMTAVQDGGAGASGNSGGTNNGGASGTAGVGGTNNGGASGTAGAGGTSNDAASGTAGVGGTNDGGASREAGSCATSPNALDPILTFTLTHAAFPGSGHPDVAVHIPSEFTRCVPAGLVVFFQGFDQCVSNMLGAVDSPCENGGAVRGALHLVDQFDAAHVNAILIGVQLSYDRATGDPGQLTTDGEFQAMLHELAVDDLSSVLKTPLDVADFERVILGSYGAGYQAVAAVLQHGGVSQIREVDLYDDLLGDMPVFSSWVQNNLSRFDGQASDGMRWTTAYTTTGGTLANSQAFASSVAGWLNDAGANAALLDDRTTATLGPSDYAHPLLFKQSTLSHTDVPKFYFGNVLTASGLAPLP